MTPWCPEAVTELQDFTLSMLGTKDKPALRAKAAETSWLLEFALDVLDKYKDAVKPEFKAGGLAQAGKELVHYLSILRQSPLKLSQQNYQVWLAHAMASNRNPLLVVRGMKNVYTHTPDRPPLIQLASPREQNVKLSLGHGGEGGF